MAPFPQTEATGLVAVAEEIHAIRSAGIGVIEGFMDDQLGKGRGAGEKKKKGLAERVTFSIHGKLLTERHFLPVLFQSLPVFSADPGWFPDCEGRFWRSEIGSSLPKTIPPELRIVLLVQGWKGCTPPRKGMGNLLAPSSLVGLEKGGKSQRKTRKRMIFRVFDFSSACFAKNRRRYPFRAETKRRPDDVW